MGPCFLCISHHRKNKDTFFWFFKEILPLDDVSLKKCISKLGWSFLRKANRWSLKADRPNITLYKLNFQRFVPKFCLVLMLIHRVCDDCPFFVFLLYSKGGGYSWQTTDKPCKRTSWYFWKTRIWARMCLGFWGDIAEPPRTGCFPTEDSTGFGGGLFGTPCIQEFGVELLFDRQGEQNSKKILRIGGILTTDSLKQIYETMFLTKLWRDGTSDKPP